MKVVGIGVGDIGSGQEFRDYTGTATPTMVIDEQYDVWSHYDILSNSEAVLLDGSGNEIARFNQFNVNQITAALP